MMGTLGFLHCCLPYSCDSLTPVAYANHSHKLSPSYLLKAPFHAAKPSSASQFPWINVLACLPCNNAQMQATGRAESCLAPAATVSRRCLTLLIPPFIQRAPPRDINVVVAQSIFTAILLSRTYFPTASVLDLSSMTF